MEDIDASKQAKKAGGKRREGKGWDSRYPSAGTRNT